jgi:hypothetical protein
MGDVIPLADHQRSAAWARELLEDIRADIEAFSVRAHEAAVNVACLGKLKALADAVPPGGCLEFPDALLLSTGDARVAVLLQLVEDAQRALRLLEEEVR